MQQDKQTITPQELSILQTNLLHNENINSKVNQLPEVKQEDQDVYRGMMENNSDFVNLESIKIEEKIIQKEVSQKINKQNESQKINKQNESQKINEQNVTLQIVQMQFVQLIKNLLKSTQNQQQSLKEDIKHYISCRQQLSSNEQDQIKQQEDEILKFFDGWFFLDQEIVEIQKSEDCFKNLDQIRNNYNDFENDCLKILIEYVKEHKQEEAKVLKYQYGREDTMINLQNIQDLLNINSIQLFVLFQYIKISEKDNYVDYYIKWWFDWNETVCFLKTKENAYEQ